jgi:hypothetical protein
VPAAATLAARGNAMTDRKPDWQEEGQQELQEQRQEQAERQEWENDVPQCNRTYRQEARGRKPVYIIQTCHWEYNDSFHEYCTSGGKAVAAFTTREKAMQRLRELERQRDQVLGIVEIYLDDEPGHEETSPHVGPTS